MHSEKEFCKNQLFEFSYFKRIIDMWNSLPLLVREATAIANFKKSVREHLDFSKYLLMRPCFSIFFL